MSSAAKLISPRQAARHEALYLRLAPLASQVQAAAAKNPARAVHETIRQLAEGLLFDCRAFAGQRGRDLPVAAPAYGPLAAQLGAGLAELIGFEARHTRWDVEWQAQLWLTTARDPLPVKRLAPKIAVKLEDGETAEVAEVRRLLTERINRLTKPDTYVPPSRNRRQSDTPLR